MGYHAKFGFCMSHCMNVNSGVQKLRN